MSVARKAPLRKGCHDGPFPVHEPGGGGRIFTGWDRPTAGISCAFPAGIQCIQCGSFGTIHPVKEAAGGGPAAGGTVNLPRTSACGGSASAPPPESRPPNPAYPKFRPSISRLRGRWRRKEARREVWRVHDPPAARGAEPRTNFGMGSFIMSCARPVSEPLRPAGGHGQPAPRSARPTRRGASRCTRGSSRARRA